MQDLGSHEGKRRRLANGASQDYAGPVSGMLPAGHGSSLSLSLVQQLRRARGEHYRQGQATLRWTSLWIGVRPEVERCVLGTCSNSGVPCPARRGHGGPPSAGPWAAAGRTLRPRPCLMIRKPSCLIQPGPRLTLGVVDAKAFSRFMHFPWRRKAARRFGHARATLTRPRLSIGLRRRLLAVPNPASPGWACSFR
jgi:hypothetical protein